MDPHTLNRRANSLFIGSHQVEVLMDHVFNIIWAKGVIKKMPDYIVEYLVTEARFLTNSYFSPYDPRKDDLYISKDAN
jgi:hypothetical protein